MSRKFRLATATAVLTAALASCGGGGSSGGADSGDGGTDGTTPIAQVELTFQPMSAGKLIVCTDAPYDPFVYEDAAGNWAGFDMDLMSAVARRYGLALDVAQQAADGIWLAPAAGTCDVAAAAITIAADKEENAAFSDAYFDANQSLLVRTEDAEALIDLESTAGKKIGVLSGSDGETYARDNATSSTVQSFDDTEAMYLALESGTVDGVLHDYAINASRAARDGSKSAVSATFVTDLYLGFAVARDNVALQEAINESLNEFRATGVYDEIFARYFGSGSAEDDDDGETETEEENEEDE
jgi:polar amino acid transport system substrate-binding protein